jgi:hypothetical protein
MLYVFELYYRTTYYDLTLSGISVVPTSQIRTTAIFVLLLLRKYRLQNEGELSDRIL